MNICSRRHADKFITQGYVKVNGSVITNLGTKIDPTVDIIEFLPNIDVAISEFKYILLNKPIGYICSKDSSEGSIIFELVPVIENLSYAGRLDKDSHGLILLSNDGKFTYTAFANEFEKEKEYKVKVNKPITNNLLNTLANGSIVLDGRKVLPAKVRQINEYMFSITLTEGINRQIRRMVENQGYKVLDLERFRIGTISDPILPSGKWRYLTKDEIISIR